MRRGTLEQLQSDITACERCPRLRGHCLEVAGTRRRAYAEWDYWGRPVPGFGDPQAWLWIIGLAPGAHGANRTGRVFTGDRSGDFLYAALHKAGLANQPHSTSRDDGLSLRGCFISAAVRCAPPGNRPSPAEISACQPWLDREWALLMQKRVILALGRIAWDAAIYLATRQAARNATGRRPAFAHGTRVRLGEIELIGSYHVSQQNTFTGRLTAGMFDQVLRTCAAQRHS